MKKILILLTAITAVAAFATNSAAQATSSSYDASIIAPDQKPTTGYDGGFFIQSQDGDWKLKLGVRVDTMFSWSSENIFDDLKTTHIDESKDRLTFQLKRARATFSPSWKNLSAFLMINYSVGSGGSGTNFLGNVTYEVNPYFSIEWGIDGPTYDALGMVSSAKFTMVDLPIVVTQIDGERPVWTNFEGGGATIVRPSFGLPTQIGVFLSGQAFENRFNWYLTFGNGSEETNSLNLNKRFHYSARLSYIILGDSPYGDLSDLKYTETPSLAFGIGGAFEHDPAKVPDGKPNAGQNMYNWAIDGCTDLVLKWKGLSVMGVGYYKQLKVGPAATVERGEKYLTDIGYFASIAMFAIPKKLEFHGWGTQIIREGPDNNVYEFGGGVNYYLNGHQAKFQLDYSRVVDYDDMIGTNNRTHNRVRLKAQVYF